MNRRSFSRNLALTALGGGALAARGMKADAAGIGAPAPAASGASFKISLMLWTVFHKMPFEQRLEKAASAGYQNVELVGEFEKWSDAEYQNVARKRRELGIHFDATAGVKRSLTDPAQRDAFLAEVQGMLPVMDKLECPALIVLTGDKVPALDHEAQHASVVEGLKRAADIVEPKGYKVLLENIDPEENPKYFLTSVTEGFDVIREVDHPHVRFLYDFFHEQISEGNLIEKLQKNIALVDLVHIADVPGRHEPGTGEINYTNIYKKLAELHYDRYVAMEFMPTGDEVEGLRTAREAAEAAGRA
ncbi:MAG TPA: TIM barrel protein [Terriglobia bacterium]|jgi:hydroxypyruvate isomerase|nr:TIM barrel protein [Terriglobia bacterium]